MRRIAAAESTELLPVRSFVIVERWFPWCRGRRRAARSCGLLLRRTISSTTAGQYVSMCWDYRFSFRPLGGLWIDDPTRPSVRMFCKLSPK